MFWGEKGCLWMDRNPFVTPVKCDRSPQVMSHDSGVVGVRDDRFKKGKKRSWVWFQKLVQRPLRPLSPAPNIAWLEAVLASSVHLRFNGLQSGCIVGTLLQRKKNV